jgi:Spy/CpxP family protein refolding chaperone
MMKRKIGLLLTAVTFVLLGVVTAAAQQPPPPDQPDQKEPRTPPPPPYDPLGDAIFPPEMIMSHQRELALTDEQKTYMRGEINKTSARFNELQWQLQDAMEALGITMKENVVNEQQALAQLDRVLDSEREIKRLHMELAIRLKNKLTPEQQLKLQGMRRHGGPGGPRGPGMGPRHGPDGPGTPGPRRRRGGPGPAPGGPGPGVTPPPM